MKGNPVQQLDRNPSSSPHRVACNGRPFIVGMKDTDNDHSRAPGGINGADGDKESLLMRPKEAAAFLAISARKLWELTNRREVPSLRIGRSLRYSRPALRAWVDRQQRGRP